MKTSKDQNEITTDDGSVHVFEEIYDEENVCEMCSLYSYNIDCSKIQCSFRDDYKEGIFKFKE